MIQGVAMEDDEAFFECVCLCASLATEIVRINTRLLMEQCPLMVNPNSSNFALK